jgi:hypothetical protein
VRRTVSRLTSELTAQRGFDALGICLGRHGKLFYLEASVYRLLKAHDLITSPAFVVMKAGDVTHTLELALTASGCDRTRIVHKPRLLSEDGPSYVSGGLEFRGRHRDRRRIRPVSTGRNSRYDWN